MQGFLKTLINNVARGLLIVVIPLLCISCGANPQTPEVDHPALTDGDRLVVHPDDMLMLEKNDSVQTVAFGLRCGCGFSVEVTRITGDTTLIKYQAIGRMNDTLSSHSFEFSYRPSVTPPKGQMLVLSLLARKGSFTYTAIISAMIDDE